jgi:hypothetical protein
VIRREPPQTCTGTRFSIHSAPSRQSTGGRREKEISVTTFSPAPQHDGLLRILCMVVFATMLLSMVYAAWIGIVNFHRIGV